MAKQKKEERTNAMRLLSQKGIAFTARTYEETDSPLGDRAYGLHIAQTLGLDVTRVYKTLVTRGPSGICVFCIPVAENLDLKKAARAAGQKSLELVPVKELFSLTGYVRGGCSPIGMIKRYPTVFHSAVLSLPTVCVSAGKIGCQLELAPTDLIALLEASTAYVIVAEDVSEDV